MSLLTKSGCDYSEGDLCYLLSLGTVQIKLKLIIQSTKYAYNVCNHHLAQMQT